MRQLLTDLRSGVRMLVKYPALSLVAIVTFGLGIGLTTTVFSVVNGALFKGLPFRDPGARALGARRERPSRAARDEDRSRAGVDCRVEPRRHV
jgi:hypothetical protein